MSFDRVGNSLTLQLFNLPSGYMTKGVRAVRVSTEDRRAEAKTESFLKKLNISDYCTESWTAVPKRNNSLSPKINRMNVSTQLATPNFVICNKNVTKESYFVFCVS